MQDFDLPDTITGLEDRIQYLEWVSENCSRSVWQDEVKPELTAARKKLDALKLYRLKLERTRTEQSALSQAA